jgi:hypothetical protein
MKSETIISQFECFKMPIQILTLKDSFFIYIGTADLRFENLIVSICHNNVINKYLTNSS